MESTLFLLSPADAEDLANLEKRCFSTPWSAEQYAKILAPVPKNLPPDVLGQEVWGGSTTPVFGLKDELGRLLAYLCLAVHHSIKELEVYNIAVAQEFRRNGLAAYLLGTVLSQARNQGFEVCFLEVRQGNSAAIALYDALGFVPCGRRKAYYSNPVEDALLMQLDMQQLCFG